MYVDQLPDTTRRLSETSHQIVKDTLPLVGANINDIAPVFYKKMFAAHPELLDNTFNRGNQKAGEQQKALAASVATFATMLVDDNAPDPVNLLNRIAHKHVSLGIVKDQYPIVHKHLLAGIAEVLGDAVTEEVAKAWSEVYWLMADVLIEQENILYASDGVEPGDVFRAVKVTAKEQLSDDVTRYTLEGDLTEPQPGQYTSIGVKLPDGARQLRQYSIVDSAPGSYTIAVETEGEVSSFLRDNVGIGDEVEATLAAGDLVLRDSNAPVVLISSGIGSTPMIGMLGYLARKDSQRTVTFLHADNTEQSFAQKNEAEVFVDKLANATLTTAYRESGEKIDVAAADLAGADVYLCGGTAFLQSIRDSIAELSDDAAPHNVYYELFSPNDWLIN
ncbi:globin domain-containing protein [Corynebacterium breve]|uniref:nitric oxide dioxygenase n=1 Tax=Corynebacterium breve TaxID=3049799 RepID=A0ABY8VCG7_9CORY|nr:globin domain-containing protein [Corynebacterium breve]WIM67361.1 globin domain-containing protein [Corynebacterium breve]